MLASLAAAGTQALAGDGPTAQTLPTTQPTTEPTTRPDIYHGGWIDFNKNGKMDVFEDPSQPIDKRVEELLSQMTVEEKTCQLATLYGYRRVLKDPLPTPQWKNEIWKDGVANIDEMHNGVGHSGDADNPHIATPAATVRCSTRCSTGSSNKRGLAFPPSSPMKAFAAPTTAKRPTSRPTFRWCATWDRELLSRVGDVVATEAKAIGYRNVYAPIDLARDPRWGRVVESYGEDPYLVAELGIRMTRAIQSHGIVSTAKHFGVYSEPKGGRDGNARTDPHAATARSGNAAHAPLGTRCERRRTARRHELVQRL